MGEEMLFTLLPRPVLLRPLRALVQTREWWRVEAMKQSRRRQVHRALATFWPRQQRRASERAARQRAYYQRRKSGKARGYRIERERRVALEGGSECRVNCWQSSSVSWR